MENLGDAYDLSGKTALITGSRKGIGFAIARTLAQAGASVVINGTADPESAQSAVTELQEAADGGDAWYCQSDITKPGAADALFDEALAFTGQIDILVSNASVQRFMPFLEVTEKDIDYQYSANFKAAFVLIQRALAGMRERQWGRIVTIGSVQEETYNDKFAPYGALKAAQTHLVKSLAKSFSGEGITFNNIAPGLIDTVRNKDFLADSDAKEEILSRIPVGRVGQPEDCSGAALLLCSQAGEYITGANIFVEGGIRL